MAVTLEDLRAKAKALESELNDINAAIRVMERFDGAGVVQKRSEETTKVPKTPTIGATGVINLDELSLPAKATKSNKETLITELAALVQRFGAQEFTVNHVLAALDAMGKGNTAKHFKNRVSVTIRKMTEDGVLERSHEGAGNDPHRYKLAEKQVSLLKEGNHNVQK
jgi:hypothetical protein